MTSFGHSARSALYYQAGSPFGQLNLNISKKLKKHALLCSATQAPSIDTQNNFLALLWHQRQTMFEHFRILAQFSNVPRRRF
jgi:hypothetical protein